MLDPVDALKKLDKLGKCATIKEAYTNHIDELKAQIKPYNRRLSDHITTRPYRAPEVILLEKHYYKSIDIWSAGVVMADLF